MPTPPNVPSRGGRSLYGLTRLAAPFVLAIAALAAGVLWVSTGGGTSAGVASPVTVSRHGAVVHAARAERTGASAARPTAERGARAPREAVRHARPATASHRSSRPARPHPRPGSPKHGSPEAGAVTAVDPGAAASAARRRAASAASPSAARGPSATDTARAPAAATAACAASAAAGPGVAGDTVSALLGVSREAKGAAERTADLYARHGQRVYSFCRSRLRNPEEAQDAAQTAFLYALGSLRRGVVPRNELAWLLTIADNVCRSSRRTLGRRLAHVANADVDELEAAAPALNAETREEIAQLRAALEQLPDRQRQAILLREWQGLSYADIAEQLGLSLAAVETLLFRSRRSLIRRLRGPRARLGVLDLASGASLLRSVLGGTAGKAAVGAAALAVVAAPVARHELAAPPAHPAATVAAVTLRAAPRHAEDAGHRPRT